MNTRLTHPTRITKKNDLTEVVIRLAGDSGDGIQLIGGEISAASVALGNDIKVLPDFPAEIRAPAGTQAGVSAYQVRIGSRRVYTSGDVADVLVAMNPAALKVNLPYLAALSIIIINEDAFTERNYALAGVGKDFLNDPVVRAYESFVVPITTLTLKCLAGSGLSRRYQERTKNFFALGLVLWLYGRGLAHSERFIADKFKGDAHAALQLANIRVLRAGYAYGDASELFRSQYHIPATKPRKLGGVGAKLRSVTGSDMLAEGAVVGAYRAGVRPFYTAYPITPASTILHKLARLGKKAGVLTFQAEDEISAVMAALGASYGGNLGITGTSGPGFTLKMEALGLAVMVELPLVILDVQRAGPSTGMPTKGEQADLHLALYGRHGEAPVVVTAAATPSDCFLRMVEACVWAVKYRIPVVVLADANLANGSEPWEVMDVSTLPSTDPEYATPKMGDEDYLCYRRSAKVPLQRSWAFPGMAGLQHRLGGLEKDAKTGNVSYDGENHHKMVLLRKEKVMALRKEIPLIEVMGNKNSPLLVVTWGSTYGVIKQVLMDWEEHYKASMAKGANQASMKDNSFSPVKRLALAQAYEKTGCAYMHLKYLNPFPSNFSKVLNEYSAILVIEKNLGQLTGLVKAHTYTRVRSFLKVDGLPFLVHVVAGAIKREYEACLGLRL